MEILLKDGVKYVQHQFEKEAEFEKIVFEQYNSIFGKSSILFKKQKLKTFSGIGSIPDGFIVDPQKNKWYILEVELSSHDVHRHILPQITKFKTSLRNYQNRKTLIDDFDKSINANPFDFAIWQSVTNDRNTHRKITEIVDSEPELLIIIDGENQSLEEALSDFPFKTRVNLFKTYYRDGYGLGDSIFSFETYDLQRIPLPVKNKVVETVEEVVKIYDSPKAVIPQSGSLKNATKSPSANEWASKIPELRSLLPVSNWKIICNYLKLDVGADSARRVLKKYTDKNRPDWPSVPEV